MSSIDENVTVGEQGLNLFIVAPSRFHHLHDKDNSLKAYHCYVIKEDADKMAYQLARARHRDYVVYALVPAASFKAIDE